jgi:hypothetical protein
MEENSDGCGGTEYRTFTRKDHLHTSDRTVRVLRSITA